MNKKSMITLLIVAVMMITFIPSGIANAVTIDFDYEVKSGYYQYNQHDMEVEITNNEDSETTFEMNELDVEGDNVQELETWVVDGDSTETLTYEFNNNDEFPYEIVNSESGEKVFKGFTAPDPSEDWKDGSDYQGKYERVGFGDIVYNSFDKDGTQSNILHNPDKHEQVLVTRESNDYILLHYRVSVSDMDDDEKEFLIVNEDNGDEEHSFTTATLYDVQGETDESYTRRAFVPMAVNDEELPFLDYSRYDIDDRPFKTDLDEGVYHIGYQKWNETDNDWDIISEPESLLLVGNEKDYEWELDPVRDSVRNGRKIQWDVYVNTEAIYDVFDDDNLLDFPSQQNFDDELEEYQEHYEISYQTDDELEKEDEAELRWDLNMPTGDLEYWDTGNSVYTYDVIGDYEIREFLPIEDSLNGFLENIGLGDEAGNILFSVIFIIAGSAWMAVAGLGVAVVLIGAIALAGFFAAVGLLPMWLIVLIGIMVVGAFMFLFSGGGE